MNRRQFIALIGSATVLPGCSNSAAFKTVNTAIETSFGNSSAFDPAYPDTLPYASISVSIKGLSRALLILGKAEGEDLHWISADRSVLVTRHGRIVKTAGFNENLNKTDFIGNDYFGIPEKDPGQGESIRVVDITPGNRYGIKIESSIKPIGKETITIGNRRYETTRFDETCYSPLLSWRSVNSFWIDSQGKVWRSIQQASPACPLVTIEVTKPFKS